MAGGALVVAAMLLAVPAVAAADTDPSDSSVTATVTIVPAESCITVDLATTLDFGDLDFGQSAPSPTYGVQSCSTGPQALYGDSSDATNGAATAWSVTDSGVPGLDEFAVDGSLDGGGAVWLGPAPALVGDVATGATAQAGHTFVAPPVGSTGAGDTMTFEITWTAVVHPGGGGGDEPVDCDDGNPDTFDWFNEDTGECEHHWPANGTLCDNGDPNTINDMWWDGVCQPGTPVYTYYPDIDGDGYGTLEGAITTTDPVPPPGYAIWAGDCAPEDPNIHPGAEEIEGTFIDENCDGIVT